MGHDKNDELGADHAKQDEHRQELRDEVFEETGGDSADFGSQDERRKDGEGRL